MANTFATTWKHIRRSPYQALAAIAVLTLTFFIASVFTLATLGSNQILKFFETRPQVTAFFDDSATLEDIDNLKTDLESQEFVSSVKFVSREEALAIYREQNKEDPLLLEMVTSEILPSSLEVSGISIDMLPHIAEIMTGQPGVEEVVYQRDVIEALRSWTRAIRIVGLTLVGFLALTSVLIIMIIVGMKIASRRHEIEVLHLIGATSWYIKNPFVIEGALYGAVGSVLAWGISYIALLYATPFLTSFLGEIPLLPVPIEIMLALLGAEIVSGAIIGGLGSLIAVRRFLRS